MSNILPPYIFNYGAWKDRGDGVFGSKPLNPGTVVLSAVAVSQDQIDLSWSPELGYGVLIQRSTNIGGPFTTVYFTGDKDNSVSLYSHDYSQQYYFRGIQVNNSGQSAAGPIVSATTLAPNNIIYVSKSGVDNNLGTSGSPVLTLQKGLSLMGAGDLMLVGEGDYGDDGGNSAFNTGSNGNMSVTPDVISSCVLAMDRSGTPTAPIVIKPNPANTLPATINGNHIEGGNQSNLAGVFAGRQDYIHIKDIEIKNCAGRGIYEYDRGDNSADVIDELYIARGWVVEGTSIHHIGGSDNDAGIACWSTDDWVIRNNTIFDIYGWPPNDRGGAGVMSYGTVNNLVEFNHIYDCRNGIFWKDHYVANATTREPVFESEVRYNLVDVEQIPMMVGVQPDNEAGENFIHNNIFVGANSSENNCIRIHMNGVAFPTTAKQTIKNNLCIGGLSVDSSGIQLSGVEDVVMEGNIIMRCTRAIESKGVSDAMPVAINGCDYNVYGDLTELASLDRYSSGNGYNGASFADLAAWSAATVQPTVKSLQVNNPDSNGAEQSTADCINDYANGDYSLKAGSVAIGLMPSGTNAGPYEFGSEIIGVIS